MYNFIYHKYNLHTLYLYILYKPRASIPVMWPLRQVQPCFDEALVSRVAGRRRGDVTFGRDVSRIVILEANRVGAPARSTCTRTCIARVVVGDVTRLEVGECVDVGEEESLKRVRR